MHAESSTMGIINGKDFGRHKAISVTHSTKPNPQIMGFAGQRVPPQGLEPFGILHWRTAHSESGDAESDVTDARIAQIRWLVEQWGSLPEDVCMEILRLTEGACKGNGFLPHGD